MEGLSAQELVEHLNGAIRRMKELKLIEMIIKSEDRDFLRDLTLSAA